MKVFSLLSLLFLILWFDKPGFTQAAIHQSISLESEFSEWGEVYFAVPSIKNIDLRLIVKTVSVARFSGDTLFAFANREMMQQFLQLKVPYTLLTHPRLNNPVMYQGGPQDSPMTWNYYPTYTAYESLMTGFMNNYPALCHIDTLTTLSSGRRILVAKISDNVNSHEEEPEFLYTSSIHGNELTGYVLMLELIEYLLINYATNAAVADLVNNTEIYICPLANPDGTFHGGNNTISGAIRYNANYVDLNRNFPDLQDGEHPDGYAWQPETVAFMNFAAAHDFTMGANFHTGAEVFNYPWDTWAQLAADNLWWVHTGRAYADTVHLYSPSYYFDDLNNGITNGYAWYQINGGRQDYMNYFHYCREVTIELTNSFIPPAANLPIYWNYHRHSFLNFIKEASFGIRGVVSDSITGQAVRAKVYISGHDFDSSQVYSSLPVGNYHRYLSPGQYDLTFSAPGYITKTITGITTTYNTATVQNVLLRPVLPSIVGRVIYDTNTNIVLQGVTIYLTNTSGDTLAVAMTDTAGSFHFENLQPGSYTLLSFSSSVPGGINSVDALLIMRHFVHIESLNGLRKTAADVTGNNGINSQDALMVQQRFVGLTSSFPILPWLFQPVVLNISQGINTINISGLCAGDVNASYIP